jgi:hypothetical protein
MNYILNLQQFKKIHETIDFILENAMIGETGKIN